MLSYVIVSDYCEHEKSAVAAFIYKIMDVIRSEMSIVETDGQMDRWSLKPIQKQIHIRPSLQAPGSPRDSNTVKLFRYFPRKRAE